MINTLINIIGIGNSGSDTNLQVLHNDGLGTATKIDLGVDFPANRTAGNISTTVYSIQIYNEVMSTNIKYQVINRETGAVANGTVTTNLPSITTPLNFFASRAAGSVTPSTVGEFNLIKLGVYSI